MTDDSRPRAWRLRRLTGRAVQRLGRRRDDAPVEPPTPAPVVSVIVPVYNVAAYVETCLRSILAEGDVGMEVIVIDDGSTDESADIVAQIAATDPRVVVHRQPNAGLGAARNAGVRRARGRYLFFVDSDDVVAPGGLLDMVASAEASGSDIVVGAPVRLHDWGRRPVSWTPHVHDRDRIGIPLTDHPALMRNNYTWGKLYRASLWHAEGLWFREGVSYEDQPLVTQLMSRARSIDVLARVVYHWRARSDFSSLSQQAHDPQDLRDRATALRASVEALRGSPLLDDWITFAIDAQLRWYLTNSSIVDEDYWQALHDICQLLSTQLSPRALESVDPGIRAQFGLVAAGRRDLAVEFQRRHGHRWYSCEAEATGEGIYMKLPFFRDAEAGLPDEFFLLPTANIRISHRLDRVAWTEDGLHLEGQAYLRLVDLRDGEESRVEIVLAMDDAEVAVIPAQPQQLTRPPIEADVAAPYTWGGFRAVVPRALLADLMQTRSGEIRLGLRVRARGYEQAVPLSRSPRPSTAPVVELAGKAVGVVVGYPHEQLRLVWEPVGARAADVAWSPGRLEIAWDGADRPPPDLVLRGPRGQVRAVEPDESGRTSLKVPARGRRRWQLVPAPGSGALVLAGADFVERSEGQHRLRITGTVDGGLRIQVDRAAVSIIEVAWSEADRGLTVTGVVTASEASSLALALASGDEVVSHAEVATAGGPFRVTLPVVHRPDRHGERTLSVGSYELIEVVDGARGRPLLAADLESCLPLRFSGERARITVSAGSPPTVQVDPPDTGAGESRYLRRAYARSAASLRRERPAVLLTSYFGESATCNGVGLQQALQRRGSELPVYWTVQDFSVPVPEGATPVLRHSREWYELRATATYYLDNMYQPEDLDKPGHQVMVQTFHGYPFKTMGLANWQRAGMSQERIGSYHRRSAQWDYLVSPATYATPLLREHFGYDGPVLEIGYPRNDVLLGAQSDPIRRQVRESFGIRPEQCVVLYAPTFRDYLSPDDHRAPMVDFLDLERLAAALGENARILVRGHAFNRRFSRRAPIPGNCLDVTDYPEVSDLILASDTAVLDYSSLRFDYALTRKPMIFHVPDIDRYLDTRGWLLDYPSTAPGPHVGSTDEVIEQLSDLAGVRERHAADYATFLEQYVDLDDGGAGDRLVDAVFVPRGDAAPREG